MLAEVRRAAHAPLPRFPDHDPSGQYGQPHTRHVRLAVLGDSSITGPGLPSPSSCWIAQLVDRLPWDVELTSHARGGSRARDVLVTQAPRAVQERPDLFVVSVGANDVLHLTPARQYGRDLSLLLDQLLPVAPVVALGIGDLSVIPRIPWSLRPALAHRCATLDRVHARATARRRGVVRVPVAELSDPHFRRGGRGLFVEDLFHPNTRGHSLWAELFGVYVHEALLAADDGPLHPHTGTGAVAEAPGSDRGPRSRRSFRTALPAGAATSAWRRRPRRYAARPPRCSR